MRRHLLLAATFGLALSLSVSGCASLKNLFKNAFQKPALRFKTVNLRNVSLSGLNLDTVWTLDNPNPIGLSLATVDYSLFVEGKQVVAGKPKQGLTIPADKTADLVFPADLKFQELAPTLGVFLNQDTAKYRVEGHLGVKTPIGIITLPLSKEGSFEVPKVPQLQFEQARITNLTLSGATIELPLKLTNRNSFPLPVGGIAGNLNIGGANVGTVSTGDLGLVPGKGSQTVKLPVTIHFAQAAQAVMTLRNGGNAQVKLNGNLTSGNTSVPINLSELANFVR